MGPQTKPAHAILDQFHKASEEIGNNSDLLAWLPTLQQYTPGTLAECEEAIDLSRSLAKEWSYEYMHREEDQSDRESLSESLADFLGNREKFKSHGRRISIDQANDHGFATVKLENDQKLQDLVLSVFHATIHTHTGRGIDKIIENHDGRSVLKTRTVKEGQGSNPDRSQSG
jgi:hypothetical protein